MHYCPEYPLKVKVCRALDVGILLSSCHSFHIVQYFVDILSCSRGNSRGFDDEILLCRGF